MHGIAWTAYAPNLGAIILGAALFFLARRYREAFAAWMPLISAIAIGATLVGAGIDGVHRWISLGGFRLNASAAFAPWLLLVLASPTSSARVRAMIALAVAQVVHVAQPDAGQATALAAGLLPLMAGREKPMLRWPLVIAALALAALAWTRPDPLLPVDYVEGILGLAAATSVPVLLAVVGAGVLLLLPFVVAMRAPRDHALVLYLAAAFAITFIGNFPVPIFGAGAGPVLGWYALLGVRAIAAATDPA